MRSPRPIHNVSMDLLCKVAQMIVDEGVFSRKDLSGKHCSMRAYDADIGGVPLRLNFSKWNEYGYHHHMAWQHPHKWRLEAINSTDCPKNLYQGSLYHMAKIRFRKKPKTLFLFGFSFDGSVETFQRDMVMLQLMQP